MVSAELVRKLLSPDNTSQRVADKSLTEEVKLSMLFKGDNEKLLQGKTPEQIRLLQSVATARIKYRNGDKDALSKFPTDLQTQQIAKKLERELAVIHKAFSITDGINPLVNNALVVHGEVRRGEANNPEGIIR